MVICVNRYRVKPGTAKLLAQELNESGAQNIFRSQPGCICFDYSIAIDDEDIFYLTDVWQDAETFEAHTKCPGIPIWHALKDKYVVEKDVKRYDTV